MFIFLKSFESSHPKQLSYWYLWEDQIEKRTHRSFTISLRDSLNKMKTEIGLGTKIKIHTQHKFPFTTLSCTPFITNSPSLTLQKIFGPLDLRSTNSPFQKPAPNSLPTFLVGKLHRHMPSFKFLKCSQ